MIVIDSGFISFSIELLKSWDALVRHIEKFEIINNSAITLSKDFMNPSACYCWSTCNLLGIL